MIHKLVILEGGTVDKFFQLDEATDGSEHGWGAGMFDGGERGRAWGDSNGVYKGYCGEKVGC